YSDVLPRLVLKANEFIDGRNVVGQVVNKVGRRPGPVNLKTLPVVETVGDAINSIRLLVEILKAGFVVRIYQRVNKDDESQGKADKAQCRIESVSEGIAYEIGRAHVWTPVT